MDEILLQRSPLAEVFAVAPQSGPVSNPGILLTERPFLGYLNLRAEPVPESAQRIERGAEICLPLEPNTSLEIDKTVVSWLGPDEWMIVTPPGEEANLARGIRTAMEGRFFLLTDITHGNTTIRIHGPRTIEMLGKGCSLDLSPPAFRIGSCAQSLLAKANIMIRCVDHSPSFDIVVRRSFAEYVALWLEDASLEYGLKVYQSKP